MKKFKFNNGHLEARTDRRLRGGSPNRHYRDPRQNQPPCATLSKFIGVGCQSELRGFLLQLSWPLISNE